MLKLALCYDRLFGETVAVNRGLNVKATTDIDVAFAWLEFVPGTRLDARADR